MSKLKSQLKDRARSEQDQPGCVKIILKSPSQPTSITRVLAQQRPQVRQRTPAICAGAVRSLPKIQSRARQA